MAWITPIVNWIQSNVLTHTDMNRIEGNIQYLEDNKVDKVAGKGLSTTDYTTAEKTKLSGIETGATADQTASEILTAIKTVDGAGSGLDADLLDGNHATAFALSSHAHSTYDRASSVLSGANVFSNIVVADGITTAIATRALTKSDISLGSVENYGIATTAEAQAGTSNVKYMTPLRVREAGLGYVSGTYTGQGYPSSDGTLTNAINVGFQPKAVFITILGSTDSGNATITHENTYKNDSTGNITKPAITVTSTGFSVYSYKTGAYVSAFFNKAATSYLYIAMR